MNEDSAPRASIIGAGVVGETVPVGMRKDAVYQTNSAYWNEKGNDFLGAVVLPEYGAFISEDNHPLLGDVAGKAVLEIGCGNGGSLQYLGERGAAELWGMDISENQLEKASQRLVSHGLTAKLIHSPMEEECGVPAEHFDLVLSIYALGWTTDLEGTFSRIASYLKTDGVLIFSWSHPIHKCVAMEDGRLVVKKSYFNEAWYSVALDDGALTLSDRMLSTYVNALARAGFALEQMVEQSDPELLARGGDRDFTKKAEMIPATFVIKAQKR